MSKENINNNKIIQKKTRKISYLTYQQSDKDVVGDDDPILVLRGKRRPRDEDGGGPDLRDKRERCRVRDILVGRHLERLAGLIHWGGQRGDPYKVQGERLCVLDGVRERGWRGCIKHDVREACCITRGVCRCNEEDVLLRLRRGDDTPYHRDCCRGDVRHLELKRVLCGSLALNRGWRKQERDMRNSKKVQNSKWGT